MSHEIEKPALAALLAAGRDSDGKGAWTNPKPNDETNPIRSFVFNNGKKCLPIRPAPTGLMLRNVTQNQENRIRLQAPSPPATGGRHQDEPKTKLRNEPNLILCFQQSKKWKANLHRAD